MSSGKRIVDRLDPRLVNVLTAFGFGLPIAGYFWFLITSVSMSCSVTNGTTCP